MQNTVGTDDIWYPESHWLHQTWKSSTSMQSPTLGPLLTPGRLIASHRKAMMFAAFHIFQLHQLAPRPAADPNSGQLQLSRTEIGTSKTAPSMLQHPSLDHFSTGRSLDFVPTILCPELLTIQNPEIDTAVGRTPRHFVWWKRGKNEKIGGSKIKDDQGPKLLWMRPVFHTPKISLLHVATIATTSLTKLQIRFRGTLFYNQL